MKRIVMMSVLLVVLLAVVVNIGVAAEKKKVLLLETSIIISSAQQILQGLEQAGFVDQKNMTYSTIRMSATDDVTQLVAEVKEVAPDVIVANIEAGNVLEALKNLPIPVITGMNVDRYVTAEGVPTANITGVYTVLPDMVYNSYKFLQKIAPLKQGQSVVYLDNPEFQLLSKDTVMAGLQRLEIPVKAVVDATVYEDWQQAMLKYSNDPEVGWILRASPSKTRRQPRQYGDRIVSLATGEFEETHCHILGYRCSDGHVVCVWR